jgi:hypothetical protein
MIFLRNTSVSLIVALSAVMTSCENKTENWLNDYAKTKCAYQQEQQMIQDDSVKLITPLTLKKENLLQELTLLSAPFHDRIELNNQKIEEELGVFGDEYRKKTDKHSAKYGHVSTPEYEKAIENLQIKRDTKISLLKENIKIINNELNNDSEIQNKSLQIELLKSSVKHQPIIDSLQQELNILNINFKNILNELTQEEKENFEMSRDSIRNNPCNHVRK